MAAVAAYARRLREEQAGSAGKAAFISLGFALGEAFQFDWSTEYALVVEFRRNLTHGGCGKKLGLV